MAASLKVGGYQCKFIDELPDDLLCKSCRHVARQPHLTSCCGEHYCHTCIAAILQDKKPCPSCKEDTFTIFMNKRDHRRILGLRVCCTNKDHGCQWTGKVEHLDTHLDVNSGDCQYVDIECPEKCGQQVQKHQLASHIANDCPKRDFTCMHCGFKATYEVVSEQHWPECQNYPVPCPNRCQIGAVERNTLEDHLKMCSLQVVDCDFSYAGCNEKLLREDMEKHIEENTQKHLALMAAASMKMSREFEQKLQEQRDEFRGYLEQKERETAEQLKQKDEQTKAVEERLQQSVREREEKIESMRKSLQKEQREGEQQLQQQFEQKGRETAEQLKQKDQQIKVVEERLRQLVKEKEEQKELQKEQKEGEQQMQQQLEQKERQINHIQESLQEKDNKVQGELHEKQLQIEALKEQIVQVKQAHEERIKAVEQRREEQMKSLEVQSQQQVERIGKLEKQRKDKEQELEQLNMKLGMPPFHFTMSNFNQLKTTKTCWDSPPMYTHLYGYKFHITVYPSGVFSGAGTHVSVYLYSMPGEFDATLQWPAKFTITLQLLNQHRDQDHITVTRQFQWKKPESERVHEENFSLKLIAHTDLELNAQKQTQYLKDNCLRICITEIEARK